VRVCVHVGSVLLMYRYCVALLFSLQRALTINVVSSRVTFYSPTFRQLVGSVK